MHKLPNSPLITKSAGAGEAYRRLKTYFINNYVIDVPIINWVNGLVRGWCDILLHAKWIIWISGCSWRWCGIHGGIGQGWGRGCGRRIHGCVNVRGWDSRVVILWPLRPTRAEEISQVGFVAFWHFGRAIARIGSVGGDAVGAGPVGIGSLVIKVGTC